MRIYLNELRKIFSFRTMLIALIFFALSFAVIYQFEITNYLSDNRQWYSYEHYYAIDLMEKFGPTLEPDEFEQVQKDYDSLIKQADDYISSKEVYAKYGIHNYKELKKFKENPGIELDINNNPEHDELVFGLYENTGDLDEEIEHLGRFVWYYKTFSPNSNTAIFSEALMNSLHFYEQFIVIMATIFVCIVVSPLLVTDNLSNIRQLQYHTRKGKKVLLYQLAAMITASWAAVIFFTFGIMAAYIPTGVHKFLDIPLENFRTSRYIGEVMGCMKFGEYLLAITGLLMLLATGLSMILFCVAKISKHYIALILKVLPIATVVCYFGYNTIYNVLCRTKFNLVTNELIKNDHSYYLQFIYVIAIVFVIGAVLTAFTVNYEKIRRFIAEKYRRLPLTIL